MKNKSLVLCVIFGFSLLIQGFSWDYNFFYIKNKRNRLKNELIKEFEMNCQELNMKYHSNEQDLKTEVLNILVNRNNEIKSKTPIFAHKVNSLTFSINQFYRKTIDIVK